MTASIVGIGTWLPETVRTNDAWPASFLSRAHARAERTFNDIPEPEDPLAATILARDLAAEASDPFLGTVERRVADASMSAPEAEAIAALRALEDAKISGSDVDIVLSQSIVPDHFIPTAPSVAHRVGAHRARAIGVDTACSSSVAQLDVARAYIESKLAKVVLLVQSHLLLRVMPLEHPATPGLGDAASAMVIAEGPGLALRATFVHTHGEFYDAVSWVRSMEPLQDPPWWKTGDDYRLGSREPKGAKALMRDTVAFGARTISEAAALAGVDIRQATVLASVQPRGFIPGAIAERAGMARERAVTTYERIAHVGACGPVFNLEAARRRGLLQRDAWAAMYGQGAGFTRTAAILQAT
jgi:3-oxoacyl-[acyl-carrier-protein] synthase-3